MCTRITRQDRERIKELMNDTYYRIFHDLDSIEDVDADTASRCAGAAAEQLRKELEAESAVWDFRFCTCAVSAV